MTLREAKAVAEYHREGIACHWLHGEGCHCPYCTGWFKDLSGMPYRHHVTVAAEYFALQRLKEKPGAPF